MKRFDIMVTVTLRENLEAEPKHRDDLCLPENQEP